MTSWARAAELFQVVDPEFTTWTAEQEHAHALWSTLVNDRMLLFYPTGKGKTKTSLGLMVDAGYDRILVVAPPRTHPAWRMDAIALDLDIIVMSHAKFRMDSTKFQKGRAIIVDEFHLLGGHGATGWKKLDRNATGFPAIILSSATPEYNDAERAYCVAHVLDPVNNTGGFNHWIHKHCETKVNPFASTPYVLGFLNYAGAAEFLVDQGYTAYVRDEAEWAETTFMLPDHRDDWFEKYNYDRYQHKMIASDMEKRHRRAVLDRVNPNTGLLWDDVTVALIEQLEKSPAPWLLFCFHATIAEAVHRSPLRHLGWQTLIITGDDTSKTSEYSKKQFIESEDARRVLVGSGTLATGTDGLDKVCSQLMIFDAQAGDPSFKRQLIGRVLPRGLTDRPTSVVEAITE